MAEDKAGKLAEDLAEFKLRVAETYVIKAAMLEQTSQIMRVIESIGHRIDGPTERLDRFYENQPRGAGYFCLKEQHGQAR